MFKKTRKNVHNSLTCFKKAQILHCWKILLWNNLSCKVRVMAQFLNQCTHMWLHWLLLGTCDYIECNIEVNTRLSSKSQCTHMWLHWLLLLWKGYFLSFVVSFRLFVFFNNANTVSAEMWVWGFGNHKWYKSLKSRVEDKWVDKTFVSRITPLRTARISGLKS